MMISIHIDDEKAPAVAGWLVENAAKLADRVTPLPGQTVGDTAACLRFANDAHGGITQRLLDLANEPRPSRDEA